MNLRLLFCIGMGLFTAYLGLVMLVAQLRQKPKYTLPPPPNFKTKELVVVDKTTGEKTTYREFTVTTKFAPGPSTPPPVPPIPPEIKPEEPIIPQL